MYVYNECIPITIYRRRALKGWIIIMRKRLLSTKSTRELRLSGCVEPRKTQTLLGHLWLISFDGLEKLLQLEQNSYICIIPIKAFLFMFNLIHSNLITIFPLQVCLWIMLLGCNCAHIASCKYI